MHSTSCLDRSNLCNIEPLLQDRFRTGLKLCTKVHFAQQEDILSLSSDQFPRSWDENIPAWYWYKLGPSASMNALCHCDLVRSFVTISWRASLRCWFNMSWSSEEEEDLPFSVRTGLDWRNMMVLLTLPNGHVTCFHVMNSVTCLASCQNFSKLMWPFGNLEIGRRGI